MHTYSPVDSMFHVGLFPWEGTFFLHTAIIDISTEQERRSCAIEDVMQCFIPTQGFISWFHWLETGKEEELIIEVSWSESKPACSQPSVAHDRKALTECEAGLRNVYHILWVVVSYVLYV